MTTPSGGNSEDEIWRRPEQPAAADGTPDVHRPGADRAASAGGAPEGGPGEASADTGPVHAVRSVEAGPTGPASPEKAGRADLSTTGTGPTDTSTPAGIDPDEGTERPDGTGSHDVSDAPWHRTAGARADETRTPDTGATEPSGAGLVEGANPWSREGVAASPWARPDPAVAAGGWTATGGEWPAPTGPSGGPAPGGYAGPPVSTPPPPGWRPPVHVQVPPPRRLPPQDMVAMDHSEQRAQQLTYGIGAVVGVVLLLLTCLLCSRILF
ncbi:hypothetical protein AB0H28_09845 [Micromonospora sp. NPDC050980]|uniref:hypothetical protein n=1 Tax=Micromonospora sp. NPDC050980 TaxID=3155161 RepID=UPI0033C01FF8